MEEPHIDESAVILFLKCVIDNNLEKWDKFRDLAANNPKSLRVIKYFKELFANGFHQYVLLKDTELYRARIIKTYEWKDTGIVKKQIRKKFFSIFLPKEEVDGIEIEGLKISPENLLYGQFSQQEGITKEQRKKYEILLKNYSKPDFYGFSAKGCGVAPKDNRGNGRLSKKTNAYLYLSLERETAIQEKRPIIEQSYNIGVGVPKRDLKLANLRDEELYNTTDFNISSILYKISEPNTDREEKFYNITQILAKCIKKQGFDGIIYKSSLNKDGSNIMLFKPKLVKFVSSEVVDISDIDSKYNQIYPNKLGDTLDTIPINSKSHSSSQ